MNGSARQARPIVAQDQVRLGPGRGLQLALSGMVYRLFRSSVTIAILSLATAFLVHILSFGLLQQATERRAYEELSRQRQLGQSMTRLGEVDHEFAIIEALAVRQPAALSEYARWSGLGATATAAAVAIAERLREATRAFGEYPIAARAVLLGDASAEEFLLALRPDQLVRFDAQTNQLGVRPPLGTADAFRRLVLEDLPRLRRFVVAVQQGQQAAITALGRSFGGKPLNEVLRQPSPELAERLAALGFQLTTRDLEDLSRMQGRVVDVAAVNRALQNGEVATDIGRAASIEPSKVSFETLSDYITQLDRATAVRERLLRAGLPPSLSAARLLELTTAHRQELKWAQALGGQTATFDAGRFGLSERNQWLALLSFLVCIVGVANAMLMSVTERFTEIATMKCLGAMDGFVMMMFVFEAMIQGVAGGLVGLLVGLLLALLRALVQYGSLLASVTGVVGPIFEAMGVSLVVSVALAALAAVGPAWLAARLSPMEAMRVE